MKRATFIQPDSLGMDDPSPVVDALGSLGIHISPNDAYEAWRAHSRSVAAGWLCIPSDPEQVLADIQSFIEVVDVDNEGEERCPKCRILRRQAGRDGNHSDGYGPCDGLGYRG